MDDPREKLIEKIDELTSLVDGLNFADAAERFMFHYVNEALKGASNQLKTKQTIIVKK